MVPIIIVSGLPRSGTSLMMQMLEAGGVPPLTDAVRAPDDDNPRGYYELEAVKNRDFSWLNDAEGKAVKVIAMLLRTLPTDRAYKVVVMRRDLDEIAASQAAMLSRAGKSGAGMDPDALIRAMNADLTRTLDWLNAKPAFDVLEIEHRDVITDPARSAGEVAAFIDGLDVDAMAGVVDPTLHRNRSKSV